jgi:hypothetical protein
MRAEEEDKGGFARRLTIHVDVNNFVQGRDVVQYNSKLNKAL